jgi:hypothetical protein
MNSWADDWTGICQHLEGARWSKDSGALFIVAKTTVKVLPADARRGPLLDRARVKVELAVSQLVNSTLLTSQHRDDAQVVLQTS